MVGGRDQQDEEKARLERQALRDAIQALRLPEENWRDVEHVPVAVALPIPASQEARADYAGQPLGANGRFCIGLPTQVQTGVPLWVSAHFHGKIDRTAIDFGSAYNALLLNAAEELSESLIERLKSRSARVGKALGHARNGACELGNWRLRSTRKVAWHAKPWSWRRMADSSKAKQLRMPKATDLPMFDLLVNGIPDIETYGFCLPDATLLANARAVLDGLAEGTEAADTLYLQHPTGLPSVLEHAASKNRAEDRHSGTDSLLGSCRGSVQRTRTT